MHPPERPFRCEDAQGRSLRGVLTPATSGDRQLGLVLLNSGMLPRYCFHRHYVKGARTLAAAGVSVLRIDLDGLGDSDGEFSVGPVEACWLRIQLGELVPSTLAAVRAFRQGLGLRHLVLGGSCGGAITALLAAAEAPDLVSGCLAISLPVCLSEPRSQKMGRVARDAGAARGPLAKDGKPPARGSSQGSGARAAKPGAGEPADGGQAPMHPREAELLMAQYLRKLLSPSAWMRLLSGRSERGTLRRAVQVSSRRMAETLRQRILPTRPAIPDDGRFNPRVLPALRALAKSRLPLMAVLGELDTDADDFRRYLKEPVLDHDPSLRRGVRIERLRYADHTFAHPDDERLLWGLCLDWLRHSFHARPKD